MAVAKEELAAAHNSGLVRTMQPTPASKPKLILNANQNPNKPAQSLRFAGFLGMLRDEEANEPSKGKAGRS